MSGGTCACAVADAMKAIAAMTPSARRKFLTLS